MESAIDVLRRNWWALALRGLVAGLFGLFTLVRPTAPFIVLVALLGAWFLADGVLAVVSAVLSAERGTRWIALVAEGAVGVIAGAALYLVPGITLLALLYVVAVWAVLTGSLRVWAATRLRRIVESEWLLGASGLLSILFGLLVAVSPDTGAVSLTIAIGVYALLFGILLVVLSARLLAYGREYPADRSGVSRG
jgi:uncharacterized membrane protein HdeD (DUF308 family)